MIKLTFLAFGITLVLHSNLPAQVAGGSWERSQLFLAPHDYDGLGDSLVVGPDMDGDGYPEVAVALYGHKDARGNRVGALVLASGLTGQALWMFEPKYLSGSGPDVGRDVSFIPDLNGDGVADLISGCDPALGGKGRVFILSGADGSLVREHQGTLGYLGIPEQLGGQPAGFPDVDGDGFGDYAYTVMRADSYYGGLEMAGRVDCRSGYSGQLLWQAYGLNEYDHFGRSLCLGPDLDGDSVPELLASSSNDKYIYALNGVTGQIMQTYLPPTSSYINFGWTLATLPDLDGDSMDEIVVFSSLVLTNSVPSGGSVAVISSSTGVVLWSHDGEVVDGGFGSRMSRIADLNQDGFDELAVYETDPITPLHILSGVDGGLLWTPTVETMNSTFGNRVGSFDRDGDGIPELLISENGEVVGGPVASGLVHVMSFKPYIYRESFKLSASTPKPLRLRLDFPDSEAGKPFAILASATGTTTTVLHGLEIPLIVDSYFQSSVHNPPASFRGNLDSSGDGLIDVLVPPYRVAPLAGSTLYFAAVTGGGGHARLSSVAVPVPVVP